MLKLVKTGRTWSVVDEAGEIVEGGFFDRAFAARCRDEHEAARRTEPECDHDWQEQPGEPPIDVCS